MLPPSNYRISLKKNISLKTLDNFHPPKKIDTSQSTISKPKIPLAKKFFHNLTQHSILSTNKAFDKTFTFDSSDHYIRRILIANGWHQLPSDFSHAKLKWIAIPKPIHFKQSHQSINHFKDSYKLTTKIGLYNLLANPHQQQLIDNEAKNYLKYFPRSYDLGAQYDEFCNDFTHTAVLNLMKKLMIHIEIIHQSTLYLKYKAICQKRTFKNSQEQLSQEIQFLLKNKKSLFENQPQQEKILVNKTIFANLLKYWKHFFEGNHHKLLFCPFVQQLKTFSKLSPPFNNPDLHFSKQSEIGFLTHASALLFFKLYFYCLQTNSNFLNDGLSNIWIIKSNESSRGRNIFLIDEIGQTLCHKNGGNKLIQKYIENVWILNDQDLGPHMQEQKIHKIVNKKFDIRFWVLVKSFWPLDAYIFTEGYLRLSSESYKFAKDQELQSNLKIHLTNFSVNFLPYLKNQKPTAEDSENEDDNSYLLFSDFLKFIEGGPQDPEQTRGYEDSQLFKKIYQKIQHVIVNASINWRTSENDKNSFELFGFDIILDSELEPYILECNMSPACHERGELKNLLDEMGQGLLEIVGLVQKDQHRTSLFKQRERKWIKFNQNFEKDAQTTGGKTQANLQDLSVVGESKNPKHILNQEHLINFVSKVSYLQSFFKKRYRDLPINLNQPQRITRSCLLTEALAKVANKRQKMWTKKLLKYLRKINKKRQAFEQIDYNKTHLKQTK